MLIIRRKRYAVKTAKKSLDGPGEGLEALSSAHVHEFSVAECLRGVVNDSIILVQCPQSRLEKA
jgi:hypothetical protein